MQNIRKRKKTIDKQNTNDYNNIRELSLGGIFKMAKATTTNNYLQIVPNDFVKLFVDLYSKQKEFNKLPAIMLWDSLV